MPLLGVLGGPKFDDISVVLYFTRLFSDLIGRPFSGMLCPNFLSTEGTLVSFKNFLLPSFGAVPLKLRLCSCTWTIGSGVRASSSPRCSVLCIHLANATASTLQYFCPNCHLHIFSALRGKYPTFKFVGSHFISYLITESDAIALCNVCMPNSYLCYTYISWIADLVRAVIRDRCCQDVHQNWPSAGSFSHEHYFSGIFHALLKMTNQYAYAWVIFVWICLIMECICRRHVSARWSWEWRSPKLGFSKDRLIP